MQKQISLENFAQAQDELMQCVTASNGITDVEGKWIADKQAVASDSQRFLIVIEGGVETRRRDASTLAVVDVEAVRAFQANMQRLSEAALKLSRQSNYFVGANVSRDEVMAV